MDKTYFRNLWYNLSAGQRYAVRRLYYLPSDLMDKVKGDTHKYVPSKGKIYTGSPSSAREFIIQSNQQLELLKEYINIEPDDKVLDIGSGIGRTAIALSIYLNQDGSYDGFDVVKSGVEWCNDGIGKDYSNFTFKYVPLFNDLYNNETQQAAQFTFPYSDAQFDKIFTFSVFTHMQIGEIAHYLHEIKRVLKSDGMAFSTFFLYDENDEELIATQQQFNFPIKRDGYRLMNEKVKSGNIAIHKSKLRNMMASASLVIETIQDGFWKGKSSSNEYQDIVVFKAK